MFRFRANLQKEKQKEKQISDYKILHSRTVLLIVERSHTQDDEYWHLLTEQIETSLITLVSMLSKLCHDQLMKVPNNLPTGIPLSPYVTRGKLSTIPEDRSINFFPVQMRTDRNRTCVY